MAALFGVVEKCKSSETKPVPSSANEFLPLGPCRLPAIGQGGRKINRKLHSPNLVLQSANLPTGKTCGGDSGGAIVADRNGDGTWLLYGIVSFGTGCGTSTGYSGYVDVAAWTDTILPMIV